MEINGYENYLIYSDGRVWSKKGKGKFLKSTECKKGYLRVKLYNKGKRKNYRINRLVALHYIPNPENKSQVDHINRIKNDNRIENLRWVTDSENQQNVGVRKDNTSGHKNIHYQKQNKKWRFQKNLNNKKYIKDCETKRDVLCFKFAYLILENHIKVRSKLL